MTERTEVSHLGHPGYQPHPYALLLPALTGEEYAALKADIARHGILYPIITDEADQILDGVHRNRIAAELGITPPVSRHEGLTDERKLHLAVGLNMRRRHLDADRRRELVRSLHTREGLSLRKIASVTGWSKTTVERDLKTSPFEAALAGAAAFRELAARVSSEDAAALVSGIGDAMDGVLGWADRQWKQGRTVSDEDAVTFRLAVRSISDVLEDLVTVAQGGKLPERTDTWARWDAMSAQERQRAITRIKTEYPDFNTVPFGTR